MRKRTVTIIAICLAAAPGVGCGGDEGASDGGASARAADGDAAQLPRASGVEAGRRPRPDVPQGPTSPDLIVRDLIEGTGDVARRGDILVVRYVGGIYETGREIESAGSRKRPIGFLLGGGDWALGFESGLPGMRVGGRREVIFPTSPADLPPGAELGDTLVYIVDLVEINRQNG